MILPSNKFLNK